VRRLKMPQRCPSVDKTMEKAYAMSVETMAELDRRFNEKWSKVEAKMREAGGRTEEHIAQQRAVANHVYMSGVSDFAEIMDAQLMKAFEMTEKECPIHGEQKGTENLH
jgi:hypothetical protein